MEKVIYQAYPHFYKKMLEFLKENEVINECDVCFVGDSLTEMMDISYFKDYKCVNRGISSDKSAGILMTLDDRVIATRPKTIFMLIGSNDICDGYTIKQIERQSDKKVSSFSNSGKYICNYYKNILK